MNNIITKFLSGAVGGAFDSAISSFPGVNIVWGALKGGVSNIRVKRAEEFIIFIQNEFNLDCFNDDYFVDGLAITFESFLKQRSDYKRKIIKNIFLGFSFNEDKEDFELERMYDIVNRISKKQIDLFTDLKNKNEIIISWKEFNEIKDYIENYDDYKYLEFLGLVGISQKIEISTMIGGSQLKEEEHVFISDFGDNFITFILKDD